MMRLLSGMILVLLGLFLVTFVMERICFYKGKRSCKWMEAICSSVFYTMVVASVMIPVSENLKRLPCNEAHVFLILFLASFFLSSFVIQMLMRKPVLMGGSYVAVSFEGLLAIIRKRHRISEKYHLCVGQDCDTKELIVTGCRHFTQLEIKECVEKYFERKISYMVTDYDEKIVIFGGVLRRKGVIS